MYRVLGVVNGGMIETRSRLAALHTGLITQKRAESGQNGLKMSAWMMDTMRSASVACCMSAMPCRSSQHRDRVRWLRNTPCSHGEVKTATMGARCPSDKGCVADTGQNNLAWR